MKRVFLKGVAVIDIEKLVMARLEKDIVVTDHVTKTTEYLTVGVQMMFDGGIWVTIYNDDIKRAGMTPDEFLEMIYQASGSTNYRLI